MLEREIALVAGASRGIGRQAALTLGRESVAVVVDCNGSAVKAEEVVREIEATGGEVEAVQCSVSDLESYDRMMVDTVSRCGRLDILVSNAGITRDNLLVKMSEGDFGAVIDTSLEDVFSCIKHTSRQMLGQKAGRAINVSSVSGALGNTDQADYYAAGAGVIGITKPAARELTSRRVTVNTVAPGFIITGVIDVLSDSVKTAATEQISMKHFGGTQGITETVASLVFGKAGYITGQVLSVDGGMAMQDVPTYAPGCRRTGVRLV